MDADSLRNALRKREEGRGLKNSEITALRQFDRAEIFSSKPRKEPARISESDTRTTLTAGKDTLWQESQESSSPGGGGYTEGAAVDVVQGSDSKLVKVVTHSTSTTPTAFPTILKVVNGTTSVTMDSSGITMTDSAGDGKSFTVTFAALLAGKAVSLRVDSYCDVTTTKSQMHLATAPYV